MPENDRDVREAIEALERLVRHHVITPEEARQAGRLLTGDAAFEMPAPRPPQPPRAAVASAPAPATPSPSPDPAPAPAEETTAPPS